MDWLGFYYKLTNPQTNDALGVSSLLRVYNATCNLLTQTGFCDQYTEPAWRTVPGTPYAGLKDGIQALVTAGEMSPEQQQRFLTTGTTFGVSEDASP